MQWSPDVEHDPARGHRHWLGYENQAPSLQVKARETSLLSACEPSDALNFRAIALSSGVHLQTRPPPNGLKTWREGSSRALPSLCNIRSSTHLMQIQHNWPGNNPSLVIFCIKCLEDGCPGTKLGIGVQHGALKELCAGSWERAGVWVSAGGNRLIFQGKMCAGSGSMPK
eukprot:scaffold95180_cov20-Tisochrysis_lutea.AAC.1